MTTHEEKWPAGTPCWTDIMVKDLPTSQGFYASVLGWTYSEGVPEFGGYTNALVGDRRVAGLSPTMPGMEEAPNAWTAYLSTDDIAATTQAVTDGGGQVMAPPMQVGEEGSMAIYVDPTGAVVGAWQPANHTGFQVAQEAGSVAWVDEVTPEVDKAKEFYAGLFGYTYADVEGMPYAMFTVPGGSTPAGGIGSAQSVPGPVVPHWAVCFQVDDVDACVGTIGDAGGTVVVEPFDFEFGRLLVAKGPDGEDFSVMSGGPGS